MFSCLQILEAFLWFVLITLLNVTLIILTLSVSRLLNLLLRLVAFLLFLDRKSGSAGMPRPISYAVFCLKKKSQIERLRFQLRDLFPAALVAYRVLVLDSDYVLELLE